MKLLLNIDININFIIYSFQPYQIPTMPGQFITMSKLE
jgi:hypothetical protein